MCGSFPPVVHLERECFRDDKEQENKNSHTRKRKVPLLRHITHTILASNTTSLQTSHRLFTKLSLHRRTSRVLKMILPCKFLLSYRIILLELEY
uniref:Uncharacterized protein n=1 Tax=Sus scrofa TaxID=9823 RepID=A0A4X1VFE6_PIG